MIGSQDARFPVLVGILDAEHQRLGLELPPHERDVEELRLRHRCHMEAAVVFEHDEPVGGEPHQRFAQWTRADAVAIAQVGETQPRARLQTTLEDVVPQPLEYVAGEGSSDGLPFPGLLQRSKWVSSIHASSWRADHNARGGFSEIRRCKET